MEVVVQKLANYRSKTASHRPKICNSSTSSHDIKSPQTGFFTIGCYMGWEI